MIASSAKSQPSPATSKEAAPSPATADRHRHEEGSREDFGRW